MACLEHACPSGHLVTFNNSPAPVLCPNCGERCCRVFDERDTTDDDRADEPEEEGDE